MAYNPKYMDLALEEAQKAGLRDEVPVGAVLVVEGRVIAAFGNEIMARNDPTAHAEILVLREAGHTLKSPRIPEGELYVTLEPCPMCAQAIAFGRLKAVYFGAPDPKGGGILQGPKIFTQPTCHHHLEEVCGPLDLDHSPRLLKEYFKKKRQK